MNITGTYPSDAFRNQLLEDVFAAYFRARRNKRNTTSQLAFEMEAESNLIRLFNELLDRCFEPEPYVCFIVDHPIKREVFASQFRDRIVHHLLFGYIEPIFERRFIFDSYSCRKGKGTSEGIKRLEHHIRSCSDNYKNPAWVLKLDLKGYFMSIDKNITYQYITTILHKHWAKNYCDPSLPGSNPEFIDFLLRTILFKEPAKNVILRSDPSEWIGLPPTKSLLHCRKDKGLPIGDLTSQLFSNIYMGVFDNYLKRTMRIKHYGRYVDDFFVVHNSKGYLKDLIPEFRKYLWEEFELTLHPDKIYLQDVTKGVLFLGGVIKPHRTYPSDRCVKQFRHAMNGMEKFLRQDNPGQDLLIKLRARINSYLGHLGSFKSRKIIKETLNSTSVFKHFAYIPAKNKVILLNRNTIGRTG